MTTTPEDEDSAPVVPEPPRRVPFGVAVTTSFLVLLALLLFVGAIATLVPSGIYRDEVGEAAAEGLGTALIAIAAVLVAATAWSFARNGNTVGPMIVGGLTVLAGLICLAQGVMADTDGVRVGLLALAVGLGTTLPALMGQSPLYLAARRVWAQAEKDWLHDLATPEAAPLIQPWQPPQQGQPWPGPHYGPPHQPQPYPAQLGQPVQPGQPAMPYPGQPAMPYPGHYPGQPGMPPAMPSVNQPWPAATWPAQATPASAPPMPGAQQNPPSEAPQVPHSGPPHAAAQHAPTEQIRTATPPAPASVSTSEPATSDRPNSAPPAAP
ncbi:hypothetical protein [Actinoplanes sp. NPDC049681]|uniref:hypothetical protein n=1 Tax=Actinoplanes sp. NPDC049681 TaxID=3363905 RepID=UPI0037B2A6DB